MTGLPSDFICPTVKINGIEHDNKTEQVEHPSNRLVDARADLNSQLAQSLAQGSDEINGSLEHYGMSWCSE